MTARLCLVSAFLDIGRQDWSTFRRSMQQYFANFSPYTRISHDMIVFMDDKHIETLRKVCGDSPHIKIIPINREWMHEHIHAYRQLPREREIMESESFKKLVSHRLGHPECSKPEYNIMQHAKIDFVCHVITHKLADAEYFAWTDFGYFQDPSRIPKKDRFGLDLSKFNLERVNFQAMSNITKQDFNVMYTLTQAPERVGGFFYMGAPAQLLKYQELYHEVCRDFHTNGIVDDDQHIMLQSLMRNPTLFAVWNMGAWHVTYLAFAAQN